MRALTRRLRRLEASHTVERDADAFKKGEAFLNRICRMEAKETGRPFEAILAERQAKSKAFGSPTPATVHWRESCEAGSQNDDGPPSPYNASMAKHLTRLKRLESQLTDCRGPVPHSHEWFRFWDAKLDGVGPRGFDDAAAVPGTSPTSLYLPITEIVDVTTIAQLAQG